jgi:hypothetical protein
MSELLLPTSLVTRPKHGEGKPTRSVQLLPAAHWTVCSQANLTSKPRCQIFDFKIFDSVQFGGIPDHGNVFLVAAERIVCSARGELIIIAYERAHSRILYESLYSHTAHERLYLLIAHTSLFTAHEKLDL